MQRPEAREKVSSGLGKCKLALLVETNRALGESCHWGGGWCWSTEDLGTLQDVTSARQGMGREVLAACRWVALIACLQGPEQGCPVL